MHHKKSSHSARNSAFASCAWCCRQNNKSVFREEVSDRRIAASEFASHLYVTSKVFSVSKSETEDKMGHLPATPVGQKKLNGL